MDHLEKAELIAIGIKAAQGHELCEHTVCPLMDIIDDDTLPEWQRTNAARMLLEYMGLEEE